MPSWLCLDSFDGVLVGRLFGAGWQSIALGHFVERTEQSRPIVVGLQRAGWQAAERYCETNAEVVDSSNCQPASARTIAPEAGFVARKDGSA